MSNAEQEIEPAKLKSQELQDNALAVKAALRDIERGEKGKPFEPFAEDFRAKNNIFKCE